MTAGASDPDARRRFGRYETLFRIAGGGMAEVYAARILGEGGFEKVVALKRMLPTLAEDERFVDMFLDEGRVAANISSPYVVQTTDLGRAKDDSLYLVMELVVGVPLNKLILGAIKRGEFVDLRVGVEILAQAALGLHDAHQATTPMGEPLGLIHRDISPQNILVDRAGRTRITDFGVARALQRHSHTRTGEIKGKMAYFAPEQARGSELTHRVDIFALGIVAWELIAGRRLFRSEHPLHTLRKIMEEPIPSVLEHRPDVPPAVDACITKALQRDAADRFSDAREFAEALRAAHESASAAEIGDYVREYANDALRPVEEGLRIALAENIRLPPESEPVLQALEEEDVQFSEEPTKLEIPVAHNRRVWLFALLALLAMGISILVAWKIAGTGPTTREPLVEETPSEEVGGVGEVWPPAREQPAGRSEAANDNDEPGFDELPRGVEPPPIDVAEPAEGQTTVRSNIRATTITTMSPSEMNTEVNRVPEPEPTEPEPTEREPEVIAPRHESPVVAPNDMEPAETPENDPSTMILMEWGS